MDATHDADKKRIAELDRTARELGWESFDAAPEPVQNNIAGSIEDGITVAEDGWGELFGQLAEAHR